MANVTVAGASYSDVPAVDLPQTGGGTVRFVDSSAVSNDFTVTVSWDDDYFSQNEGAWVPDKTFAEIQSAYGAGKSISVNADWYETGATADGYLFTDSFNPYLVYCVQAEHGDGIDWYLYIFDSNGVTVDDSSHTIWPNFDSPSVVYTPSNSQQTDTIVYDSNDYNGIQQVNVTVNAMPSGAEGTPVATKGSVSNHAVSVTPSVINTAGYISGGTHTGTAVSVSASELVSGNLPITQNGTGIDVANYATVSVDVSGGGSSLHTGTASATPSSASASISFTGLSGEPTSFYIVASGNLATGAAPYKTAAVVFDGTNVIGQTITNTSNVQVAYDGSGFSKSYSNGTLTVTGQTQWQAVEYLLFYSYGGGAVDTIDVQVGSGATSIEFDDLADEPAYWSVIFKSNFSTSSGYQRVITVGDFNSEGCLGLAMGSGAVYSETYWTASYSNGTLTLTSQGTNAGGYFHQPGYYQLTYAYGAAGNYQSKTVTPTESQQTVTADTGYDALKRVTVNAIPSQYIVPSGNISITSNTATGQSLDVSQYATATVSVPTGGGGMNMQAYLGTATRTANSYGATTVKLTVAKTGTYTVSWTAWRSSSSGTMGTNLHVNDTTGTNQQTFTSTYGQCITLTNQHYNANDVLTIYATSGSTSRSIIVSNLIIEQTA